MCIIFYMSPLFKVGIDNHLWQSLKMFFHLKSPWPIKWWGVLSLETREMLYFLTWRNFFDKGKKNYDDKDEDSSSESEENQKGSRCFWCNKIGHIKKNYRWSYKLSNVAENESGFMEEDWGKCFMAETTIVGVLTCISFDFEDDWIFYSWYEHLMGDASKFSSAKSYNGDNAIVTADNTIDSVEKAVLLLFLKLLTSMIWIVVTMWNMRQR